MARKGKKNKEKLVAALLAFFGGPLGLHRFYLGQTGLGVLYICTFFISWIVAIIDTVVFLAMDEDDFDFKYNRFKTVDTYRQRDRFDEFDERRAEEKRRNSKYEKQKAREANLGRKKMAIKNPHKLAGIEKYKDYDFNGAIVDFKKALQINYQDVAVHFNLACAYSINEDKESSFFHLDKSVEYGFLEFDKIKSHDALSFLRIQPEYEAFISNGFRLNGKNQTSVERVNTVKEEKISTAQSSDLLDQLKKLGDLRERGLLTDEEFQTQKEKLLRS